MRPSLASFLLVVGAPCAAGCQGILGIHDPGAFPDGGSPNPGVSSAPGSSDPTPASSSSGYSSAAYVDGASAQDSDGTDAGEDATANAGEDATANAGEDATGDADGAEPAPQDAANPAISTFTFWDVDSGSGYTGNPIGDWMVGSYKGQCPPGSAVVGISASATPGPAQDIACLPMPGLVQDGSCRSVAFDPGDDPSPWGSGGVVTSDWDVGYYKAECNSDEYVAGVSQSTAGALDGILCCPAAIGSASSCEVQDYADQNSPGYSAPDWDYGFYKGECPQGGGQAQVVLGVSAYASASNAGAPHALLCCELQ